ncbi:hypothetical protein IV102_13405 [bacterium]|nr:hypothetical protein [bacterium]
MASSLAAMGFFLVLSLLIRVSGVVQRVVTVSSLQQNCKIATQRVIATAERCDVGGVSFVQDPALTAIALHPVEEVTATAHKRYEQTLTLYCWTRARQTLEEIHTAPLADPDRWQPHKLTGDEIGLASLRPPTRVLSRTVTDMQLYSADGNCPIRMRLDFGANAPGFGTQTVRVERHLNVHNVL